MKILRKMLLEENVKIIYVKITFLKNNIIKVDEGLGISGHGMGRFCTI